MKNYRPTIFLSSTFSDLENHRKILLDTFRKFQLPCIAMEDFGARPGNSLEECIKAVQQADLFVLIVGTKYGSCPDGDVSITELEYQAAIIKKLDVYVYIINEKEHSIKAIHVENDEKREKLRKFIGKLSDNHIYAKFDSPEDLVVTLSSDMVRVVTAYEVEKSIADMLEKQKYTQQSYVAAEFSYDLEQSQLKIDNEFMSKIRSRKKFSEHMIGLYLATHISEDNFEVLKGFVSFEAATWRSLIFFLTDSGINEEKISQEIICTFDLDYLRLLIKLSGDLSLQGTLDSICIAARSVNGSCLMEIVNKYRYIATPFFQVVSDSLSNMKNIDIFLLEIHMEESKKSNHYQAYNAFKNAKKKLKV
ncbi:DUF4062 domain-containing protein [Halomonas salipaludis]|uniref:DUF4062 domain-containing protein n=1 Tax=Halomonas salipaludis TaxID=2032625 RepID=A0A2A2F180_9GAMM|nr:DUF4062 domain-containing protein [Halomonas salipaludis]PAU78379.1 hypothetical protein CK498_06635 [Halomonas salipaludis]